MRHLLAFVLVTVSCCGFAWSQPIDEIESIEVNGTEQFLYYHGEDVSNPVILFVHGGPGSAMMGFARYFEKPFLRDYTIVHWDQRGAGKSYRPDIPASTFTLDQFASDGLKVTEHIRKKFENRKILLLGHSWGTMVGSQMAQRNPEHYTAIVAMGFVVDIVRTDKLKYEFLLREAEKRNEHEDLALIKKYRKFPAWTDRENFILLQRIVGKYGGMLRQLSFDEDFGKAAGATKEYDEQDFVNLDKGELRSFNLLASEIASYKATDRLGTWQLPVYFVQGKYDMATPTCLVEEYLESAQSEVSMEYVLFEDSAHFPAWENRDKFLDLLLRIKAKHYVEKAAL